MERKWAAVGRHSGRVVGRDGPVTTVGPPAADGVGTVARMLSTTLRPVTLLIQSSGRDGDPVREDRQRDRLDVLGSDVVAAAQDGVRPADEHQGERPARGRPDHDVLVVAARGGQRYAVCGDGVVDGHGLDGVLHGEQSGGVGDRVERHLLALPGDAVAQDVQLLRLAMGYPKETRMRKRSSWASGSG